MPNSGTYISGSCNIGLAEIRRRRVAAQLSVVWTIATVIALVALDVSNIYRLLIFFPLLSTIIGWFQVKRKFCLAYGFRGTFNFEDLGKASQVVDPAMRKRDRTRVVNTLLQALALAIVPTIIFLLIPA